jgi:hypothetical protein
MDFRRTITRWLGAVRTYWTERPGRLSRNRETLDIQWLPYPQRLASSAAFPRMVLSRPVGCRSSDFRTRLEIALSGVRDTPVKLPAVNLFRFNGSCRHPVVSFP